MNRSLQDLASNSSKGIILTFITDILQLVNTGKERAKVSLLMTWAVLATTFPWVFAPNLYFMICWIWSCSVLDAMLEFYRRTYTSFWGSRKWAIHVSMMSQKLNMFPITSAPCKWFVFFLACRGKNGVSGVLLHHKQVNNWSLFFYSSFGELPWIFQISPILKLSTYSWSKVIHTLCLKNKETMAQYMVFSAYIFQHDFFVT